MRSIKVLLTLLALLAGCASLPPNEGRPDSSALRDTAATRLGAAIAPLAAANPGKTGIHTLANPRDAFAARMLLARAAERSIDAQYYIWHADNTGLLLFEALVEAARRGVRVRILLDDQNTGGEDDLLASLAAQPNIELRLYNPFVTRGARMLDYAGGFGRLNRRMHNKAFIADNQAAVVGGRNVGDEYFGAGTVVPFVDLDVLAVGAAVREVSAEFDRYWSSASAYPAQRLLGVPAPEAQAARDRRFEASRTGAESREYLDAVRDAPFVHALLERRLALEWSEAHVVTDDPAKTLDEEGREDVLLLSQVLQGGSRPVRSVDIISPYFVPAERGSAFLEELARSGVRVRVLTNSFEATDVSVVHAGYSKRRCGLARAGVRLFEMKPSVDVVPARDKKGLATSSAARLHAKTYAADGQRVFVGSFNFDPRSALLNTEMGLVIANPALAGRLAATFEQAVLANAYEGRPRAEGNCVEWIERTSAGAEVVHEDEPHVGAARRAWLHFLEALPIDWLL